MDLTMFLVFIGTPAFVDYVISNILDQFTTFTNLKPQVKSIITLGMSIGFGIASYALIQNVTAADIAKWQGLFTVIASMFAAWASGQIQHEVIAPALARRNGGTHAQITYIVAPKKTNTLMPTPTISRTIDAPPTGVG